MESKREDSNFLAWAHAWPGLERECQGDRQIEGIETHCYSQYTHLLTVYLTFTLRAEGEDRSLTREH